MKIVYLEPIKIQIRVYIHTVECTEKASEASLPKIGKAKV